MDETGKILGEVLAAILKPIVKEAVQEAMNDHKEQDSLLDAEQAAEILAVSQDWLYRHANRLPFTRKLAPRVLRFSYQGIQKYLSTRKNP